MPFTDEDLRRLEGHMGGWYLDNGTLTALLARLDAAEQVVVDIAYPNHGFFDEMGFRKQHYEAWLRAAGKDK